MLFQNIFILLGFTLCVYASPLLNRGFNTTVSARQLSTGNDGSGTQNTGNVGQNPVSSSANLGIIDSGVTVGQALETCGAAQLNCCKKTPGGGDAASTGILGSVFGAGDVGILCTPLDVPVIGCMLRRVFYRALTCTRLTSFPRASPDSYQPSL